MENQTPLEGQRGEMGVGRQIARRSHPLQQGGPGRKNEFERDGPDGSAAVQAIPRLVRLHRPPSWGVQRLLDAWQCEQSPKPPPKPVPHLRGLADIDSTSKAPLMMRAARGLWAYMRRLMSGRTIFGHLSQVILNLQYHPPMDSGDPCQCPDWRRNREV